MVLAISAICTQQTWGSSSAHIAVRLPSEASNEATQNWNSSLGINEGGVVQATSLDNPRFPEHVFIRLPSEASNEAKQNWNSNTMEHNTNNNETTFLPNTITS